MEERESFAFYRSYLEFLKRQPKSKRLSLYEALVEYALNGTIPNENSFEYIIFAVFHQQIDKSNNRYKAAVENGKKGAEFGKLGGRPPKNVENKANSEKKENPRNNPRENPGCKHQRKPLNDNYNENDNVNGNHNENDNSYLDAGASCEAKQPKRQVYYPLDEKLNQAMIDFVEYRKKIKSPMTDRAVDLMIGKLDSMTADNNEKIAILEQSIVNGWKGVFPLRNENTKKTEDNEFLRITERLANEEGVDLF